MDDDADDDDMDHGVKRLADSEEIQVRDVRYNLENLNSLILAMLFVELF